MNGKTAVKTGKSFNLFTSNEDINDIIKIPKSLKASNLLIGGITETVKHEIKEQAGGFFPVLLALLAASLVQPVISSVVKGLIKGGVRII